MLIIHANLQVKPDQEQAFLDASKLLIEASRAEAGNLSYDLKKSTDQDQHYTMVETWQDAASIEAHNTSAHFTSFVGQAQAFMAAPMDVTVYAGERVEK